MWHRQPAKSPTSSLAKTRVYEKRRPASETPCLKTHRPIIYPLTCTRALAQMAESAQTDSNTTGPRSILRSAWAMLTPCSATTASEGTKAESLATVSTQRSPRFRSIWIRRPSTTLPYKDSPCSIIAFRSLLTAFSQLIGDSSLTPQETSIWQPLAWVTRNKTSHCR